MHVLKATVLSWIVVVSATLTLGQQAQNSQPAFWESGNAFLDHCDENSADFAQLSPRDKQTWILTCDSWVMGIRQGIEIAQQLRPEAPPPSPAIEKQNKEEAESLEKMLGPGAAISTPSGNMCIPDDATINQLRLVAVQWMKANPTKLSQQGAMLVYAALTNTYGCADKKEK